MPGGCYAAGHQSTIIVPAGTFKDDVRQNLIAVTKLSVLREPLFTSPALRVKGVPDFPEECMAQGLFGRDALLRVVH